MTPYYSDDLVQLYHGDCREVTEWLDADVLVTDPPYGVSYRDRRGGTVANDSDFTVASEALDLWGERPMAAFANHASLPRTMAAVSQRLSRVRVATWHKTNVNGAAGMGNPWLADVEFAVCGVTEWPRVARSGLLSARRFTGNPAWNSSPDAYLHPTQKPLRVMEMLIGLMPGGAVADPFAGSGSTLVAAKQLGRRAIGVRTRGALLRDRRQMARAGHTVRRCRMSRSRASAKAAGARVCAICSVELPPDSMGRRLRRYCSTDCLNAARRAKYAESPRPPKSQPSLAERLWRRVEKMPSGCWEWQGYRMPSGHGQIGIADRKVTTTHRVAWELANGRAIPPGLMVRHKCDNPPCVNPQHLELGTAADNSRDAVERGQVARGFRLPGTILTPKQVLEIRERYIRFTVPGQRGYRSNKDDLAEEYGVSAKYIVAVAGKRERADV